MVGVDSRHPTQSEVQLALAVALEEREPDQFSIVAVRPTVVRAAKRRRVALGVVTYLVPAMRTAVQKQMQLAVAVARRDDVLKPETVPHIICRLVPFTLVTDENPCAVPDLVQFLGKNDRVRVQRTVPLVRFDQSVI